MSETLIYTTHASPIGQLLLVASPKGLRYLRLLENEGELENELANAANGADFVFESHGFLATACKAIDTYLTDGEPISLPVDLGKGTPLQRAVWLAIAKVPYGETISYTTLADRVGFPRAIRAVASACGANPVPLAIACHRIVAKDGTLGGFSLGGLEVKEKLLDIEIPERRRRGERKEAAVA